MLHYICAKLHRCSLLYLIELYGLAMTRFLIYIDLVFMPYA